MKNISRIFLFSFFVLGGIFMIGCSSSSNEDTFSISGELEGVQASYFMCVVEYYTDSIVVDTVRVNAKGEFNYRAKVDGLTKVSLYFQDRQLSPLFVEQNSNIKIEGNPSDIYSLKIDGGDINDAIWGFKTRNRKLIETNSSLLVDSVWQYVNNNKENIASLALIELYLKGRLPVTRLDSLIHTLPEELVELPYSKNLLFDINETKRAEVGGSAPNFDLKNTKDKQIRLSDYREKPILMTFIQEEDSVTLALYSEIEKANSAIQILPVMISSDEAKVKETKRGYFFDGKSWASDIVMNYNIKSTPYYVLIVTSPTKYIKSRGILNKDVIEIVQKLGENKD